MGRFPHALAYGSDAVPGLSRERRGVGFAYRNAAGRLVKDPKTLARIRSLAIPPAWRAVWICARSDGHLQATGRDQRGRKQYRYHPTWIANRSAEKFDRMLAFAGHLPRIRQRVAADLRKPLLSRDGVLATIVTLLERTLIRIGNREYAESNRSFGLTTLLGRHLRIRGRALTFHFRGKGGIVHRVSLSDSTLARRLKRYRNVPGSALFQCRQPDGSLRSVTSSDVNAYLKEVAGEDFTAKDFRTWAASVRAGVELCRRSLPAAESIRMAIRTVARRLGNTATVCRSSYIHPAVLDAYRAGITIADFLLPEPPPHLHPAEAAMAAMLTHHLSHSPSRSAA